MDEVAYARHVKRAKEAETIYRAIRELYGWKIPWNEAYFMAIRDKLLIREEKDLVKQYYPLYFERRTK